MAYSVGVYKVSLFTECTIRWGVVAEIGLDFAVRNRVGLRNTDTIGGIKLKSVHALHTISLVYGDVGPTDQVDYAHGAIRNLVLAVAYVGSGGHTCLLVVGVDSQIKTHQTLIAHVILVTHITILNVA